MSKTDSAETLVTRSDHGSVAILTTNNPPVNATSTAVRSQLKQAVEVADADPAVEAIVIACAGRTFLPAPMCANLASRRKSPFCLNYARQ